MSRLAMLTAVAVALAGCATVPPAGGQAGSTYKALGTEPFWALELTGREMVFTEANAPGVRIVQPQPRPIHGFAGDIYQTPRIGLNIVRGVGCSDGMSDRTYPDKVQVDVDGRRFEGCGGDTVMPASLANTSWTIESVNGRATGGGDRFFVRFDGERMGARFGCNSAGGSYRFDGQTLNSGPLAMTRMACDDMHFENEATQILSMPAVASWGGGDRLTLRNNAGTVVLRRNI